MCGALQALTRASAGGTSASRSSWTCTTRTGATPTLHDGPGAPHSRCPPGSERPQRLRASNLLLGGCSIYLAVNSIDSWKRHRIEGYGYVDVPCFAGMHDLRVHTWRAEVTRSMPPPDRHCLTMVWGRAGLCAREGDGLLHRGGLAAGLGPLPSPPCFLSPQQLTLGAAGIR